ncbi:MAG TPA: DNA repair protein [Xanthobacteraceae bacterium]
MAATGRPDFACSGGRTAARIDRLRRELWTLETASSRASDDSLTVPLGTPAVDGTLGGGLGGGALHEIAAAAEAATAAATGFALMLAARRISPSCPGGSCGDAGTIGMPRPGSNLVWIAEDFSLAENGAPHGPALDSLGIAPERVITVAAARGQDVLWAMEEALRCRGVGAVIGELRPRGIDRVATRRLALAAAAGGTLGLVLRTAPDAAPSAAATRWIIGAAPSSPSSGGEADELHGVGPPRVVAHLVRNRRGHLGAWILEWNSVEQRFELATDSEPVAGTAFDRSHRAAAG